MSYDPNSQSNIHQIITRHISIVWTAHFDKKILDGHVDLTGEALVDAIQDFVFDAKELQIKSVTTVEGENLQYTLENPHEVFGHPLRVKLAKPLNKGEKATVRVSYSTSPSSSAIQWLEPSQTADKIHPYLFTQCQAIHARTMLPCQDAPSVKATYDAAVTVPAELTAVMSAVASGEPTVNGSQRTFRFNQTVPMSSYLIALGVGALESREIGPRTRVWSEKSMVDKGAFEFAETESFLKTAEDLLGPYVWGRYDILLLPPSFPYGGMENPCLTFVTPTLLAGDRSNADVVAHEISHSWTGNLVTNHTWEHFWLNEGWTVYAERLIYGQLYGEKERHFKAMIGYKAMVDSIVTFGETNPLTALVPDLNGIDPDDAFSSIPYEKGFNFLFYLENLVGGREVFVQFAKAYINKFKFSTVNTPLFKEFFLNHFAHLGDNVLGVIDWQTWLTAPGHPPVRNTFDETLAKSSLDLAASWLEDNRPQAAATDIQGWTAGQVVLFLDQLVLSSKTILEDHIKRMDQLYNFSASKNAEIRFRWYQLGIKAEYEPVFAPAASFAVEQGRMKYVRPLYRSLYKSNKGKELAVQTFKANRQMYHSIAAKMVAKDLELSA